MSRIFRTKEDLFFIIGTNVQVENVVMSKDCRRFFFKKKNKINKNSAVKCDYQLSESFYNFL